MKHLLLAASGIVLAASPIARADEIFVPEDYEKIQQAIDAAVDGDVVSVAAGSYRESLRVADKTITLRSLDGPEATIIQGNFRFRGVTFVGGVSQRSTLRGFTIRDCAAELGGGVLCDVDSSPTIEGNHIVDNHSGSPSGPSGGSGIACLSGSSPLILRNLIFSNLLNTRANREGGGAGIYSFDASPQIIENEIFDNSANSETSLVDGGGLYISGGAPRIERNRIEDNVTLGDGGGLFVIDGSPNMTIVDNLIVGNRALTGGGFYVDDPSEVHIAQCTFSRNLACHEFGGGLFVSHGVVASLTNSIVYGNDAEDGRPEIDNRGQLEVSYCDVRFGWSGPGNIDADPLFVDPENGRFRLQADSPCLDAGDPSTRVGGRDVDGVPRTLDGNLDRIMIIDMGAHEFGNVHLTISGDATPGGTLTLESSGKKGLVALLFVGAASGDTLLNPYGPLFIDVAAPYIFFPLAVIQTHGTSWSLLGSSRLSTWSCRSSG